MDTQIKKSSWKKRRKYLVVLLIPLIYFAVFNRGKGQKLNLPKDKLTIAEVKRGDFAEYITVDGTVVPLETVYLDAVEGGVVENISAEDGKDVKEGETLLTLSNGNLQLDYINRETQILDLLNQIQNMRITSQQNHTRELKELSDLKYSLQQSERKYNTNKQLANGQAISRNDLSASEEENHYLKEKMHITRRALDQDSQLMANQLQQMNFSAKRMTQNLDIVKKNLDNLVVRAPLAGQLTSFDLKKGQLVQKGQTIGQIDAAEGFKIRIQVDEHYVSRIYTGQTGTITFKDSTYTLVVHKVNPQVKNGFFEADLLFQGIPPEGIRKGQNLSVRLGLSSQSQATIVERGNFVQQTNGTWIYVLNAEGTEAERRNIKLGRQNPQYYELLDGLRPGDKVIISSYAGFEDKDRLIFKDE